MRRLAGLLILAGAPAEIGCPGTCVGAGCEDDFDGSFAGVFRGSTTRAHTISPLSGDITIVGDASNGPDWSADVAPDRLFVGSPSDGTVRAFGALEGGRTLLADAPGSLSGEPSDGFGASVRVLGDVDGDGTEELLVAAPHFDVGNAHDEGAVYVYPGFGERLLGDVSGTAPALRVGGESTSVHFGEELAVCGDMDGDAAPEWAASAPLGGRSADLGGEVALASSRDLPVLGVEALLADLDASSTKGRHGGVFWGSVTGARAGSSLVCAHDVTGDGLADLWIGAPYADGTHDAEGAAYLISSGPKGPHVSGDLEASSDIVLRGEVEESWLGAAVATGRFDADDLFDIAIGAPGASAATGDEELEAPGEVLVWSGATFQKDPKGRQDIRITGEEDGDRFGSTVAFADIDGDGFDDLLVGAPYHNPDPSDADSAFQSGALYVFLGGFTSAPANLDADDADYVIVAAEQFLRTGARFAVGDYDVDGEADIVVINRYDPGSSLFE